MTEKIAGRMKDISPFYVMELLQRARELQSQGEDIIHMEIGEPDFPTPEGIVRAGIDHIRTGQVKYTPEAGLPELREKIAEYYQERYSVYVEKERIFITPGASGAHRENVDEHIPRVHYHPSQLFPTGRPLRRIELFAN